MNTEYNCKVSSKNSNWLLKNLQNTTGDYFFVAPCIFSIDCNSGSSSSFTCSEYVGQPYLCNSCHPHRRRFISAADVMSTHPADRLAENILAVWSSCCNCSATFSNLRSLSRWPTASTLRSTQRALRRRRQE